MPIESDRGVQTNWNVPCSVPSAAALPVNAPVGVIIRTEDTGTSFQWNGTGWVPFAGGVGGENFAVRYVSKGGNDATGDGSFFNPFLTIQAALNSITDNAVGKPYVVYVGPGTFATSFTLKAFVVIEGAGPDSTTIAPAAANCLSADFAGAVSVTAGINHCNISTNLVADFSAIGNTGAAKVFFEHLQLQGLLTLTGAALPAANYALLNDICWTQFNAKATAISGMSNVDMFSVISQFGSLTISADDTAFRDLQGYNCFGFGTLTITWTGAAANANNALDVVFDNSPQANTSGGGGAGQPTVTGLGAIYTCVNGIKFTSVAANAAIQFNRFLGAGSVGVAGDVIGCDQGQNHVIVAAAGDITLILRKPTNGTRVKLKNQTAFNVVFDFQGLGTTGDPTYVGPFGYADMFFSSGTWMVQEQEQAGTGVLVNGVSALIPADISASSRPIAQASNLNGSAAIGVLVCLDADKVNGTKAGGGGFKVRSLTLAGAAVAGDQSSFNWTVFPGSA